MARIKTYPNDIIVDPEDKLLGTDSQDNSLTKNFRVSDLVDYIGQSIEGQQGPPGPPGDPGENGTNGQDGQDGEQGDPGADGTSINILGTVPSCANLPITGNTSGDLYILDADDSGCSYGAGIAGDGYVWTSTGTWLNIGPLRGPQGIQGVPGQNGTNGTDGTNGVDGGDGSQGPQGIQGPQGNTGDTGAQGPQGEQGEQGIQGNQGVQGNPADEFALIGLNLSWSTQDPAYVVNSTHVPNLKYSKLGVDFENLEIESDYTYKLILERKRGASSRGSDSFRKAGYKRQTGNGMLPPYSSRPSEIEFTTATGNKFDFRWDLFFRDNGFPAPAGKNRTQGVITYSNVHFALRISKEKDNITEVSPVLKTFTLRAINNVEMPAGGQKRLTFILK